MIHELKLTTEEILIIIGALALQAPNHATERLLEELKGRIYYDQRKEKNDLQRTHLQGTDTNGSR